MNIPILLNYSLHDDIIAFSTTRRGGCSKGAYATFNANAYCGDNEDDVAMNRRNLCHKLGITADHLILPHQVHGVECRDIDENFMALDKTQRTMVLDGVDALTTCLPRVCIGVSTADCIPVLLYDAQHRAVAAIHAGWRSTQQRIVEHVVSFMNQQYGTRAMDISAVIGPGISLERFEVGQEVYDAFASEQFPMDSIARRYKDSRADDQTKWHIDLWEANRLELIRQGVDEDNIHVAGICTCQHSDLFFSARTLGIKSGRILNGIMMK